MPQRTFALLATTAALTVGPMVGVSSAQTYPPAPPTTDGTVTLPGTGVAPAGTSATPPAQRATTRPTATTSPTAAAIPAGTMRSTGAATGAVEGGGLLPRTGSELFPVVGVGSALLLGGAGLVVAGRRRRTGAGL